MLTAVSLVWAGITHGWFVKCAACWCRMINGKASATIETQTSMGAHVLTSDAASQLLQASCTPVESSVCQSMLFAQRMPTVNYAEDMLHATSSSDNTVYRLGSC